MVDSVDIWLQYCVRNKLVDKDTYNTHIHYLSEYTSGHMDIDEYMKLIMLPLAEIHVDMLNEHVQKYVSTEIMPNINQHVYHRMMEHKRNDHHILLASASPEFIVNIIAELLGIEDIIAIQLKYVGGYINGEIVGVPSYREGKLARVIDWLNCNKGLDYSMEKAYFYTDSHNDLALLSSVKVPVAVNPDSTLRKHAIHNAWEIIC
jgi:HAD superfamily hydrolase (TIGR01490 family)